MSQRPLKIVAVYVGPNQPVLKRSVKRLLRVEAAAGADWTLIQFTSPADLIRQMHDTQNLLNEALGYLEIIAHGNQSCIDDFNIIGAQALGKELHDHFDLKPDCTIYLSSCGTGLTPPSGGLGIQIATVLAATSGCRTYGCVGFFDLATSNIEGNAKCYADSPNGDAKISIDFPGAQDGSGSSAYQKFP